MQDYHGSYSDIDTEHMKAAAIGGPSGKRRLSRYQSGSRESYSSRDSRETYSQDTQVNSYSTCSGGGNCSIIKE